MCKPKIPDNSAEQRRIEEERAAKIRSGEQNINKALGGFNDAYYGKLRSDYTGHYNRALDKQYGDAREQTLYSLADRGMLPSSAATQSFGKLAEIRAKQRAAIGDQAVSFANDRRGQVEQTRGSLMDQLRASADPAAANQAAISQSALLTTPQPFSPLGDVFATALNTAATGIRAQSAGYPGFRQSLGPSTGSSSRIVR